MLILKKKYSYRVYNQYIKLCVDLFFMKFGKFGNKLEFNLTK